MNNGELFPEDSTGLGVGALAPTGFFDPLGLSKDKDAATLKQWRDAEIKHGIKFANYML